MGGCEEDWCECCSKPLLSEVDDDFQIKRQTKKRTEAFYKKKKEEEASALLTLAVNLLHPTG